MHMTRHDLRERVQGARSVAGALGLLGMVLLGWLAVRALPQPVEGAREEVTPARAAAGTITSPAADRSVPLAAVAERLDACSGRGTEPACTGVVYFWTPEMPLSAQGIEQVTSAAQRLGVTLDVVHSAELYPAPGAASDEVVSLAARLVGAGASLHAPSFVVHRGGAVDRSAVLGYKEADAYAALIEERLRSGLATGASAAAPAGSSPSDGAPSPAVAENPSDVSADSTPGDRATPFSWKDFPAAGQPGAYFRWVPGRNVVAYEAGGRIYLLDLGTGESGSAPGFVDFVPTPDGRLFVTPGRRALEFYDAGQVFDASAAGRGRSVPPIHSDPDMRDQYPSVGILSSSTDAGATRTVYRVLTSWFDKVVFRDYEVTSGPRGTTVRGLSDPVVACEALSFSIPILAPSGREVAGRDEASATTKVFRLADDGGCQEATDLQLPTGKVAWNADNRRIAFAIPQGAVSDGSGVLFRGTGGEDRAGIFLFDRRDGSVQRIEGSVDARRLAFPEFVGADQLLFLLPPERSGGPGRFRLVCCVR